MIEALLVFGLQILSFWLGWAARESIDNKLTKAVLNEALKAQDLAKAAQEEAREYIRKAKELVAPIRGKHGPR